MEPFILETISATNLGHFAMPDRCPLCLWRRARLGFNAPWSSFPGIFSTIDRYSKGVTAQHFKTASVVPTWMQKFGAVAAPLKCPHWTKFSALDPDSGVACRGTPDEMLRLIDDTLVILDYKTSKFTDGQDKLMPRYAVQLSSYAWIARNTGLGETSAAGLIYYEPHVMPADQDILANGFNMAFDAHVLPVPINPDSIPVLLAYAKQMVEQPTAPAGNPACTDCAMIASIKEMQ